MSDPNASHDMHSTSELPPSEEHDETSPSAAPSGSVDWSKPRVAAILRAAVRCFARSGFDTTTAEIAAEIGIPKSVIYHYFDDKTTLVREAQRFAYAEHLGRVKDALGKIQDRAGLPVVQVLKHLWGAPESRNIAFQLGIWSELRNDAKVREQAVALRREHHRMIAGGVARSLGIDAADPSQTEPLSTLVVAALTGLSLEAFIEGDDKMASEAHDLFLGLLERGLERFAKRPDSEIPPSSAPGADSDLPAPYDALDRLSS
jgi:AcrR family transcriptional regulator